MKKFVSIIIFSLIIFSACSQKLTHPTMQLQPEKGDTVAILHTTMGDISLLLYTDLAPETTGNFIELAKSGKYNNVSFHRVIKDFMIQTGDFENGNGTGGHSAKGPGTMIKDEFGKGLEHIKGAVSMANRGPNTGASQFFIVQAEDGTSWLNGAHAIFGYTYDGLEVVDAIANAPTRAGDVPADGISIEGIEVKTF